MELRKASLEEFQREGLERLRQSDFCSGSIRNLTVLAYYFRSDAELDAHFWRTEFAFLETFLTQGVLPAVLVVNRVSRRIGNFCDSFGIDVQEEKTLIPGCSKTLALDLVQNLHNRFDTDYVLTIQDDGFPLRPGVEKFVGRYDYIGAPWMRHVMWYDWYPTPYCVGNGGFSLRSKKICQTVCEYYRKYFSRMPYWWYLLGDDTFCCKTLRFWFPRFRNRFRWATREEAWSFSREHAVDGLDPNVLPLGFHGEVGWRNVRQMVKPIK